MANHPSAKTRIKRNEKQAAFNGSYLGKVRTLVKKVEAAVSSKDKEEAKKQFVCAESALSKAANKGVIKKATAARKTSRLSSAIKKI